MSETEQPKTEPTAEPTSQQQEPDYKALYEEAKAHARKWEARSKANAEKAEQFDASQEQAKTIEERLAALESENAGLKAEKERADLVSRVATATGLDASIVASLNGSDEDTITSQANAIVSMRAANVHPSVSDNGAGGASACAMSKAEIMSITDPTKRLAAIKEHINLFK